MRLSTKNDDFFVGYLGRVPAAARSVVVMAALGLMLGFAGAAFAVAVTADDPGDGQIYWGRQLELTGVMQAAPYPHLRLTPTAERPLGETYLIVRPGKRGVLDFAERFDGQTVTIQGAWTQRGEIQMIQTRGRDPIVASDAPAEPLPTEDKGRWRLSGEICDGKCYLGAMRPGVGLAHKACANLCIIGGAPAVLVTEHPVDVEDGAPTQFLLLADSDGQAIPMAQLGDLTAVLVEAEGRIERRGELLVFLMDVETVRLL